MKFTGEPLKYLAKTVGWAIRELQGREDRLDVDVDARELKDLEDEKADAEKLLARIHKAIEKEAAVKALKKP